ncbi:MAG TPA: beta-ketoacyl synthase N-terminal-like domain-containing protein [Thermoanaerobaculia bacterium]
MKRVVITGIGPFAPRAAELFRLDVVPGPAPYDVAAPILRIRDDATGIVPPHLRQMDRLGRIALAAAELALTDANLDLTTINPEEIGIALGSGYGCLATNAEYLDGIRERGPRRGNPIIFQNTVSNAATGYISIAKGIRGPNATMCSGWVAGIEAVDFGVYQIADGRVSTMIVGGVDQIFPALVEGLAGLGRAPMLSEGSCFLVLEELESARARGARMYAEITATGHTSAGSEDPEHALSAAVTLALTEAGTDAADIDMIVSGANGSRFDFSETRALVHALGAYDAQVFAPKRVIGETLGSGGAFAVAVAAQALESGRMPIGVTVANETANWPEVALVPVLGDDGSAAAALLRRVR